ncbi:MAG: tetratricopeptide repeat protein [Proteobacteria bacterium]|nr:tetratricopeptide repeat protein [Pseudomonadota bacterium]
MDQDKTTSARTRTLGWALLLIVFVAGVYAPGVENDFVYDDQILIVERPAPATPGEYFRIWTRPLWQQLPYYRPVSETVMAAEKLAFGLHPGPYHLVNAFLCAFMALAFFRLLVLPAVGVGGPAAFLTAALFGVHPLASSATYPATVLETLLVTLFALAAARAWLRGGAGGTVRALVFFALAMLAKEPGVVVAGVFLLADLSGLARKPRNRVLVLARHVAAWGVLAGYMALRHAIVGGQTMDLALLGQPLGPLFSLAYTLQTVFAPFGELVYEPWLSVWPSAWRLAVAAAATAGLGAWAWKRPGEWKKVLFFTGWFLVFILPTANVLHQEALFAERYNLTALAGVLGVAAVLAGATFARPRAQLAAAAVALVLVAVAAGITAHRARYYAGQKEFMEQWLSTNPRCYAALSYLGGWYLGNDQPEMALNLLEKGLSLAPSGETLGSGVARSNLGIALQKLGRLDEALEQHRLAVELAPGFAKVHLNYGIALALAQRPEEAEAQYRSAIAINPRGFEAHHNLGLLYGKAGRYQESLEEFTRAVNLAPGTENSWFFMGQTLARMGRYGEAVEVFARVLELNPNNHKARENMDKAIQLLYSFPK